MSDEYGYGFDCTKFVLAYRADRHRLGIDKGEGDGISLASPKNCCNI
ncbi:MAG: hypothetical protein JRD69_06070 [Deltaproteobacteria bacterium]|nr:hypothetical protein [Deltaproteobacteria bacterium]